MNASEEKPIISSASLCSIASAKSSRLSVATKPSSVKKQVKANPSHHQALRTPVYKATTISYSAKTTKAAKMNETTVLKTNRKKKVGTTPIVKIVREASALHPENNQVGPTPTRPTMASSTVEKQNPTDVNPICNGKDYSEIMSKKPEYGYTGPGYIVEFDCDPTHLRGVKVERGLWRITHQESARLNNLGPYLVATRIDEEKRTPSRPATPFEFKSYHQVDDSGIKSPSSIYLNPCSAKKSLNWLDNTPRPASVSRISNDSANNFSPFVSQPPKIVIDSNNNDSSNVSSSEHNSKPSSVRRSMSSSDVVCNFDGESSKMHVRLKLNCDTARVKISSICSPVYRPLNSASSTTLDQQKIHHSVKLTMSKSSQASPSIVVDESGALSEALVESLRDVKERLGVFPSRSSSTRSSSAHSNLSQSSSQQLTSGSPPNHRECLGLIDFFGKVAEGLDFGDL